MSGTLAKTSYDFGLMVAANIPTCGLSIEVQEHYLTNQHLIPEAIRRGFIIPQPKQKEEKPLAPATISAITTCCWLLATKLSCAISPALFKTADTDLDLWLTKAEKFAKEFLGTQVNLAELFAIPEVLPWKSVIPVFDPGGLTNRDAVQKALKTSKLDVWEEVDVMKCSGSETNRVPTLYLIQNSIRPDEDTMGFSPDQLVATSKNWLDLRGYALAFTLHHFVTGAHLDPKTWTWFPANRPPSGEVVRGCWSPDYRRVRFDWNDSDGKFKSGGARLAIPVPSIP